MVRAQILDRGGRMHGHIFKGESFGVLELRGGTHLVLRRAEETIEPGREAPFDLVVDDVDAARAEFTSTGVAATGIERGRIHDAFHTFHAFHAFHAFHT